MFRRLLTLVLLVPLSLNGLWITCAEAETPELASKPAANKTAEANAEPVCTGAAMCPLHKAAPEHKAKQANTQNDEQIVAQSHAEQTGAICLISPDGKSNSIAAIGFIYAPPASAIQLGAPTAILLDSTQTPSLVYLDAFPPDDTPPPRA